MRTFGKEDLIETIVGKFYSLVEKLSPQERFSPARRSTAEKRKLRKRDGLEHRQETFGAKKHRLRGRHRLRRESFEECTRYTKLLRPAVDTKNRRGRREKPRDVDHWISKCEEHSQLVLNLISAEIALYTDFAKASLLRVCLVVGIR